MEKYDYLIVGSGLFGATFARLAHDAGLRSLVIERRDHTGGNIRCENIEGVNVHRYGPHIFHTSNRDVWDFVNRHAEFNRYTNSPLAVHKDRVFNLPFNMNTFRELWGVRTPEEAQKIILEQCAHEFGRLKAIGVESPRNLEERALTSVGREIYELLIKDYTEKQWGRKCNELPADIITRLPIRLTYDNNYFDDLYQGVPVGGYNPLITSLLQGTEVVTGVDFLQNPDEWRGKAIKTIFTGRIDEYFGFRFGNLEYRSVRFETEVLPVANYQGNAVVNFTDSQHPYTRIIEHKHFETFGNEVYENPHTVITREYSEEWSQSVEPFYPVNDARNMALLAKYLDMAEREKDTIFGGRLAEYRYYDMDDVIESAFNAFCRCEGHLS